MGGLHTGQNHPDGGWHVQELADYRMDPEDFHL